MRKNMLKEENKIFKNLYNEFGWEIENSLKMIFMVKLRHMQKFLYDFECCDALRVPRAVTKLTVYRLSQ